MFVYGSLMCGLSNHAVLGDCARWLGLAKTAPRYRLLDLGPYPALVDGGSCAVFGELYEIDGRTLRRLDRFEGHPDLYRRAPVQLESGDVVLGYFASDRALHGRDPAVIESGNWRSTGVDGGPACALHRPPERPAKASPFPRRPSRSKI